MTQSTQFFDNDGTAWGIRHADNQMRVINKPYLYATAEGDISGHHIIRKAGYNADVDNTSEELWPVGGAYVFPTTGMQMEVVSSSADDDGNPAGTGVQTVELHYLDSTWAENEEIITLNGTGVVATTATNILRVNRFHSAAVGSGGVAAGNIDLRHVDNTPIYARIPTGYNNSQQCIWTVPLGHTAYITGWQVGVGNASGNRMAEFRLRATSMEGVYNAGVFHIQDMVVIQDGSIFITFTCPIALAAKTDIKVSVISDSASANAICGGHFEGWYE